MHRVNHSKWGALIFVIPKKDGTIRLKDKDSDRVIMKIRGPLVNMLVQIAPEVYSDYVTHKRGETVLYVVVLMALYGWL